MGFHTGMDLDEVSAERLVAELVRRGHNRSQGKCPYCEQPLIAQHPKDVCKCRFGTQLDIYYPPHVFKKFQYGDVT